MSAAAPALLAPADSAVLHRLRAIALLLHRAGDASSAADIGLRRTGAGVVWPFESIGWRACRRLAELMGWHDLLALADAGEDHTQTVFDRTFQRVAAAEFPAGCPGGLAHILTCLSHQKVLAGTIPLLAQAGWSLDVQRRTLRPLLPAHPSAHQRLEILAAAEAGGGLGFSPLALLARQAGAVVFVRPGA